MDLTDPFHGFSVSQFHSCFYLLYDGLMQTQNPILNNINMLLELYALIMVLWTKLELGNDTWTLSVHRAYEDAF